MKLFYSLALSTLVSLLSLTASADIMYVDSFPSASSTRVTASGTRFWNAGDYVEQLYSGTGLTQVNQFSLDLLIDGNSLLSDTQDMDALLNGILIGSFMISSGDALLNLDFSGLSVAGTGAGFDNYLLRLETTRTVNGGDGSAGIANGPRGSNLTLTQAQAVPTPATLALFGLGLAGLGWSRRKKA